MNQSMVLGFLDEMTKIAEVYSKCRGCGSRSQDLRSGWCFSCAMSGRKEKKAEKPSWLIQGQAYGGWDKPKKKTAKRKLPGLGDMAYYSEKKAKEKASCGDMLQYYADHPDKLKAKQERDKKKHAGFMQNVGTRISNSVSGAGRNVGGAMQQMFAHPIQGIQRGAVETVKGLKGHPILTAAILGGTALGIHDLSKKEDPSGAGRSRTHRAAEFIGDQAGSLIGAPFGFTGSIAGGMMGKKIGDVTGKAIDAVRGYKRTPAMVQAAPGV